MATSSHENNYYKVVGLLSQEKDRAKVKRMMTMNGLRPAIADELVDKVYADIKWHNRKKAFLKIGISVVLLIIFGAILIFSGRLFYIILALAGFGFLWGGASLIFASGYVLDASGEDGE